VCNRYASSSYSAVRLSSIGYAGSQDVSFDATSSCTIPSESHRSAHARGLRIYRRSWILIACFAGFGTYFSMAAGGTCPTAAPGLVGGGGFGPAIAKGFKTKS